MNHPTPPTCQSPIVPSKNALRALRRLALSPPVLVIGAIGSACGIATLNNEVTRRVHLAERAVESKRIIRSLSHGRGDAWLNNMIEAAERGDDFTSNARAPRKRRKKNTVSTRPFSTVAVQMPSEDMEDTNAQFTPLHIPMRNHTQPHPRPESQRIRRVPVRPFEFLTLRKTGSLYIRKGGRPTSTEAERPVSMKKTPKFWRARRIADYPDKSSDESTLNPTTTSQPDTPDTGSAVAVLSDDAKLQELETKSLGPAPSRASTIRGAIRFPKNGAAYLLPYVEDVTMDHLFRSTVRPSPRSNRSIEDLLKGMPEDFVEYAITVLPSGFLWNLYRRVANEQREVSRFHRYRPWLAIMRYVTSHHTPVNWAIAEAMLYKYQAIFRWEDLCIKPVFELTKQLLETAPNSQRVERVLFPTSQLKPTDRPHSPEPSIRYIQFYCDDQHNSSECVRELEQVLKVAKRSGHKPSKRLVLPVLRVLVHSKDFTAAERLLENVRPAFELNEYLALTEEYAFLGACEGQWTIVDSILDEFASMYEPRLRPINFGRFFERLLVQHSSKNHSSQSFGFALDAIKHAGLIPTHHITRTIICASIRDRRYDQIIQWMHMLKDSFPRLTAGLALDQNTWMLTDALARSGASCEEMARVFRMLAYGRRHNPFTSRFRKYAIELVRADLSQRLRAASVLVTIDKISAEDVHSMTMQELLGYTRVLREAPPTDSQNAVLLDRMKSDIAVQIEAIVELVKIFRGDLETLFLGHGARQELPLASRQTALEDDQASAPDVLRRAFPLIFRPDQPLRITKLKTALVQYYDQREKQKLPVDHSLLEAFIRTIGHEYPLEVLELVEAIHGSGFVQGPYGAPFDTKLFKTWLYLVSTGGTVHSAVCVLSAVLDNVQRLTWTTHLRHLCNLVAQLETVNHDDLWNRRQFAVRPEAPNKLQGLYDRLRSFTVDDTTRRIESKETFWFPGWKGWKMDAKNRTFKKKELAPDPTAPAPVAALPGPNNLVKAGG